MTVYGGSISSISIGGREFPVNGSHVVSESLVQRVTDYTGPGWLAHFKEKHLERFSHVYHGTLTVDVGSEAWEEIVKACCYGR